MTYIRTAEELTNSWNAAKESGRIEERNRIADALELEANGYREDMVDRDGEQLLRNWVERLRKGEV